MQAEGKYTVNCFIFASGFKTPEKRLTSSVVK